MKPLATPVSQLYIRASVVLAIAASIGFSILVVIAGSLRPNIVNILTQVLMVAVIVALLVIVVRRFQQTRQRLELARKHAEDEAALLRNRSAFMFEASDKLMNKLSTFETNLKGVDPKDENAAPLYKKTAELHHLLDRLETISHLEASMALTSKSFADVDSVLDEVAKEYQPQFAAKQATLQVSGDGETDVTIDASTLKQVFASIIDNACKFVPDHGGLLDITYHKKGHMMRIVFTDNGSGIDPAQLPHLFKPFSRTDGVMTFDREGQGLSLYVDKLCIEIVGGTIKLESKQGAGTTVTIDLPLAG